MMFERCANASDFLDQASPYLLRDEGRFGLAYGVADAVRSGRSFGDGPDWFGVVRDDTGVRGAALQTPPHPVNIACDLQDVEALTEALRAVNQPVESVLGTVASAEAFAARWTEGRGGKAEVFMNQRRFELTSVRRPPAPPSGAMRPARQDEGAELLNWARAYACDCGLDPSTVGTRNGGMHSLDEGRLFVWDDGSKRSMAATARETPSGATINTVYTPPGDRGKGYASVLVADLSQRVIDGGKSFCMLFTDLANPVSNSIYTKVGYAPREDYLMLRLPSEERDPDPVSEV